MYILMLKEGNWGMKQPHQSNPIFVRIVQTCNYTSSIWSLAHSYPDSKSPSYSLIWLSQLKHTQLLTDLRLHLTSAVFLAHVPCLGNSRILRSPLPTEALLSCHYAMATQCLFAGIPLRWLGAWSQLFFLVHPTLHSFYC